CLWCKFNAFPCGPKFPVLLQSSNFITGRLSVTRTPEFTDGLVDSLDSRYFFFFLSAIPHLLPYTALFPTAVGDIFARGAEHPCVRYSVISVASRVVDHRLRRPLDRFQSNYIITLQLIQKALQNLVIDEGLAIAVFLLSWIDVVRSNFDATRKHLKGFL